MFGMCMIEILTRGEPYPGESAMDVAIKVVRDGYQHPIPEHCPSDLAQVIRGKCTFLFRTCKLDG